LFLTRTGTSHTCTPTQADGVDFRFDGGDSRAGLSPAMLLYAAMLWSPMHLAERWTQISLPQLVFAYSHALYMLSERGTLPNNAGTQVNSNATLFGGVQGILARTDRDLLVQYLLPRFVPQAGPAAVPVPAVPAE
jgi:hypothetical protein